MNLMDATNGVWNIDFVLCFTLEHVSNRPFTLARLGNNRQGRWFRTEPSEFLKNFPPNTFAEIRGGSDYPWWVRISRLEGITPHYCHESAARPPGDPSDGVAIYFHDSEDALILHGLSVDEVVTQLEEAVAQPPV